MSQSQKALQAVLVEGITLAEAAERYGISTAAISKAKHHPSKKQLHATELDQLRTQLAEARLAESVHDQQANEYARKVAYWIEKHDALRAQLAEAQAEIERLKGRKNKDAAALHEQSKCITDQAKQLAASQATNEKLLALEPEWIVNDMGELGVKVGSRFFFLYKGENIEYTSGKHDDGVEPILYRIVGKREFGETCKPDLYYSKGYAVTGRYTENLVFHQGLSFGSPEDGAWRPLPETGETLPNDTTALNKLLAGVYEECAVHVGRAMFRSSYVTPEQLAEELRALAKQKGLTNEQ